MNISWHTNDRVEINFSFDEVKAMLIDKDEQKLEELAYFFNKFYTWVTDNKKIYTKRLLENENR